MIAFFPTTTALNQDAEIILKALDNRALQIKSHVQSQKIVNKIALIALKTLGLASAVIGTACIPAAVALLTPPVIALGVASLATAIACLALNMFLEPRSPGEAIVKDHWKKVFEALRSGNGRAVIQTCQELAKQKEVRATSFKDCMGTLPEHQATAFFHKTCCVGYLKIMLEHLQQGEDDLAKSNAHIALSHFDASGFEPEVEGYIKAITEAPKKFHRLVETVEIGNDLHSLDYFLTLEKRRACNLNSRR